MGVEANFCDWFILFVKDRHGVKLHQGWFFWNQKQFSDLISLQEWKATGKTTDRQLASTRLLLCLNGLQCLQFQQTNRQPYNTQTLTRWYFPLCSWMEWLDFLPETERRMIFFMHQRKTMKRPVFLLEQFLQSDHWTFMSNFLEDSLLCKGCRQGTKCTDLMGMS